jgi:hypothetical protein
MITIPDFNIVIEPEETKPAGQDEMSDAIRTAWNCLQLIQALGNALETELGQIELNHTDDNVRELAQKLKLLHSQAMEKYVDAMDGDSGDWETERPLYLLTYGETEDGHQTLIIPQLRRKIQSILGDEYTEQEFTDYLAHVREQFNLSEEFV